MSKIEIIKTGITKLNVDCIVNAANSELLAGGGVCGAIFTEAGMKELQNACNTIGGCQTGSAVITPGFHLKARYIIHAVGPVWNGGRFGEKELLYSCYHSAMKLAQENHCHTIAFPLISSGIYGYPKREAWEVALKSVHAFLEEHPDYSLDVTFAVLSDDMFQMGNEILNRQTEERKTEIIILNGSPRQGNSVTAIHALKKGINEQYDVEIIDTYKLNIAPCKACGTCECQKGCIDTDDTNPLVDKLVNADIIIFATPVYWWGITAQMKMVIDKCYCKGLLLKEKKIGVIATGGSPVTNEQYALIKGQFDCISNYLNWDFLFYEPIYASKKDDLAKDENEIQKLIKLGKTL